MEHVPSCVVWAQRPASVVGTWRPNRAADNARRVALLSGDVRTSSQHKGERPGSGSTPYIDPPTCVIPSTTSVDHV